MRDFGHLSAVRVAGGLPGRGLVNVVVTAGLAFALYRQFFVANDAGALWAGFRQNMPPDFWLWIAGIAALMPVNLYLEAYKLRVALPRELQRGFAATLWQVCAGIAVGLWTPGRVGEFAGRLSHTTPAQRAPMLAVTALGGVAQWAPLLVGGGAAVLAWRSAVKTSDHSAVMDAAPALPTAIEDSARSYNPTWRVIWYGG